ncbi:hypothetical protein [Lunatimonas salinarum]|uniref:hypothetical protein n=1 Tax=Lunatimonas salinarum TaxID=1774590 RepID=UPI001ADF4BAC|nr:hypothetical protein [Lunatimonas salinarum]
MQLASRLKGKLSKFSNISRHYLWLLSVPGMGICYQKYPNIPEGAMPVPGIGIRWSELASR